MGAEKKIVLTDEQIMQILYQSVSDATGIVGMGRAIERAVLEAAPASSAMAMQPIGKLMSQLWRHQGSSSPVGQPIRKALGIGTYASLTQEQIALAKEYEDLQSQQSPVQASDAGRQG